MNVKKFEARSMKEALEMVKTQLGPDAVILSAKEVVKGFGGGKSIEITAAYSETVLKQKEFAKSKMPELRKEQFNRSSARDQKEVITKILQEQAIKAQRSQAAAAASTQSKKANFSQTNRKYIDIDADMIPAPKAHAAVLTEQAKNVWNNMDVQNLKTEIEQLKKIILGFQKVPQNFVQSHPGAEFGVNYAFCNHFQALVAKGLLAEVAADVILSVQNSVSAADLKKENQIQSMIARAILETTLIQTQIDKKFQIFMGSSGSGKSTAMIKLAADLTLRQNKRVAIISTDTIKIGADEQMKVYSQMLNIPYVSIRAPADWDRVLPYLGGVDCVLVDCASLSLRNQDEVSYLQQMLPVSMQNEAQTHLVISAKTKDADVIEIANKYKIFHCEDLIFTGLDEVNNHGIIYNTVRKLNMPLFGFGIGPKVPDDFEYATVERVLDLILDITKKTQTTEQVL